MQTHITAIGRQDTKCQLTYYLRNSIWINKDRYVVYDNLAGNLDAKTVDLVIDSVAYEGCPTVGNIITKTPFGLSVTVARNSKVLQAEYLAEYIQMVDNQKFALRMRQPKVWSNYNRHDGMGEVVIMRSAYGARSIGLVVLDTSKTSMSAVVGTIQRFVDQEQSTYDHSKDNDRIKEANTNLYHRVESLPGRPIWSSDDDEYALEGAKQFLNNHFVQEYVCNVSKEYRVIIGGDNKPVYCIQRRRNVYDNVSGVPVAYARSCDVGLASSHTKMSDAQIPDYVEEELLGLLKHVNLSLFALDIFITKDGGWGIFEFSPEFGTNSVPNGLCFEESKRFIENIFCSKIATEVKGRFF